MSNDHQNYMNSATKRIDVLSSEDAAKADIEVSESFGTPSFGMLPGMSVPLDYVLGRQEFFRDEIERTLRDGPDLVQYMNDETIADSAVLRSQKRMLNNYTMEANQLPKAEQAYTLFRPLAAMAVRSVVKADDVGYLTGHNTGQSPLDMLDAKEQKALRQAVLSEGLLSRNAVGLKARNVATQRAGMVAATRDIASIMHQKVITKLNDEIRSAQGDKDAIEAKIEKVAKWAKYIETGASLVAGGAGKLKSLTAVAEASDSVADLDTVKTGAGYVESGTSMLSTAATFGMRLYFDDQFRALETTITRATRQIADWNMAIEANDVEATKERLVEAAGEYKQAVDDYTAAIESRRTEMAKIGAVADTKVDRRGKDQDTSQAILWMTSVFEAQSFVSQAVQAGQEAKTHIDETYSMITDHRSPYSSTSGWGKVEDIWGGGDSSRYDGLGGPDFEAIQKMRILTTNWLDGAADFQKQLDKAVGGGVGEALSQSGYSGEY